MVSPIIRRWSISLGLSLIALAAIGLSFNQSTVVRASGASPYPGCGATLQDCIIGLFDGDSIAIAPGVYTESVTLDKAISLIGDDPANTIFIAMTGDRVLTVTGSTITSSVVISGLTFMGGSSGNGGGVLITNNAAPSLENVIVSNNNAIQGGGVYVSTGSPLTLKNVQILSNTSTSFGGGLYSDSPIVMAGGLLQNNQASGSSGGGIYAALEITLTNVSVSYNSASTGGGVYVANGEVQISASSFEQNNSIGPGGGLNVALGEVYLSGTNFMNNSAYGLSGDGGGAYFGGGGDVGVMGGQFQWNHADSSGGGLSKSGSGALDIGGVCFSDNDSLSISAGGGAVHSTSPLTVADSCFDSNASVNLGGAIFADAAPLNVSKSTFTNNSADLGGGVFQNGTFNGMIVNSLFARNVVTTSGTAMVLASSGSSYVLHNTIADLVINPQAAIGVSAGAVAIRDTIIASHSIGISVTLGSANEDYNLFFSNGLTETGSIVAGSHSLIDLDPMFIDPSTDDYHLGTGSAAINTGIDAGVNTDYDDNPRPLLGAFDIGYDESHNSPSTFSIQAAIDAASLYSTVVVPPGIYVESLNLYKPVNLVGLDRSTTFIYAAQSDRVLTVSVPLVTDTIVISGLTFSGGDASWTDCNCGGGIFITGTASVLLQNIVVTGSDASRGGGLYSSNSDVTLDESVIADNGADFGGGAYIESGLMHLASGLIEGNDANTSGGGVYAESINALLYQTGGSILRNSSNDGAGVFVQDGQFNQTSGDVFENTALNWGGGVLVANANASAHLNGGNVISNTANNNGGGIFVDAGRVELASGTVMTNYAWIGGGVYVWQSTAVFTQTGGTIDCNSAENGGGIAINQGRGVLIDGLIVDNMAENEGGGVFIDDPIGVFNQSGGQVIDNLADYGGGAKIINGTFNLSGGEIVGNQASSQGGGIYVYDVDAVFNQTDGTIDQNSAYSGGGVYVNSGTAALNGGLIMSNTATDKGGGVYASDTITIVQTWLANNNAAQGGGVYAANTLVISGTTLSDNTASSGHGGGALADVLLATNSSFTHNRSTNGYGGGLYADYLILDGVNFIANDAAGKGGGAVAWSGARVGASHFIRNNSGLFGGGLVVVGELAVTATQFISNSALYGGGLAIYGGSADGRVVNSIFAENQASSDGDGLYLNTTGDVNLLYLTLANPMPGSYGSAINVNAGVVTLTNSIIASFTTGIDRTGGTFNSDYNLFYGNTLDTSGVISIGSHSFNGFPDFKNQAADDYHLGENSAAVNTGVDAGVKWDIDNDRRPLGGGFDIGADESREARVVVEPTLSATLSFTTTDGTHIQLDIPAGAVSNSTPIYYSVIPKDSVTPPSPVLKFAGNVFEFDAFPGVTAGSGITFSKPVTLTFHYSITDVLGIKEDSLKLYRYEGNLLGWKRIGFRPGETQTLDIDNNLLTVVLKGFSRFGKMGGTQIYNTFFPIMLKKN